MSDTYVTSEPYPAAPTGLLPWPGTHYGCRVVELGEDGEMFAVVGPDGHVPQRRAIAAVLHWLRTDCGYRLYASDGDWDGDRDCAVDLVCASVEHHWVYDAGGDEDPWIWCEPDQTGVYPVTLVQL